MKITIKLKDEILDEFFVTSDVTEIGRSADNDIVLEENRISRKHAEIVKEGDVYFIVDKGSGNGTRLNGERIQKEPLKDGDKIGLGESILEVEYETTDFPKRATVRQGMAAQLVCLENNKQYDLGDKDVIIGRRPECHIQVKAPTASGKHAVVKKKENQYVIEDLGSVNGTKVNGQLSKSRILKKGDTIEIEGNRFRFEIVESKMVIPPQGSTGDETDVKDKQTVKTGGNKVAVIIGIGVVVAIGIGIGVFFLAGGSDTQPETTGHIESSRVKTMKEDTKEVPVSTTKARISAMPHFLFETGEIQADDVHVSSLLTEKSITVNVENGQFVKKDDILIELDSYSLENKMAEASSAYTIAKNNMNRNRRLYEKGVIPKVEYENAENSFIRAEATMNNLEKNLKDSRIVAPISGAISGLTLETGEIVQAGQPLLKVIDLENVYVNARIPAKFIQKIEKGKKAYAEIDSFPGEEFVGEITSIAADVNKYDRTVNVKVNMDNADLKLRPGMFVKLRIMVDEHKNATVVLKEAVVSREGKEMIFVVKGNKAYKKMVETGYRNKDEVEIVDFNDVNSEIVLTGQGELDDGYIIRIIK